jgi:hypothetical protein
MNLKHLVTDFLIAGWVVCNVAWALDLTPPRTPVPKSFFGIHMHNAATTTRWPEGKIGSWQLVDAHVNWHNLQPERLRWNFQILDRYSSISSTKNIDLLLPLAFPPQWASARPTERGPYGPGTAAPPANIDDWRRYVLQVAERYKGRIQTYSIWDEPNEKGFFSGSQSELINLVEEAFKIIKKIDPLNKMVSPGFVGPGSVRWFDEYLGKGGSEYADIIGYHFYTPVGGVNKHKEQRPEAMIQMARHVRSVMGKHHIQNRPLWNTGIGYWNENSDGTPKNMAGVDSRWIRLSPEIAAAWIARSFILCWALGMERVFWYSWDHENMGLIEPTTKVMKPAGKALQTTAAWLVGSTVGHCQESESVWTCELGRGNVRKAWIIWREEGTQEIKLPSEFNGQEYLTLTGGPRALRSPAASVVIGEQPILVKSDRNPW